MKIIFLKGIPGSGKSHFAKGYIKEHINTIRVNKDDLRSMMFSVHSKPNEQFVNEVQLLIVDNALKSNKDVIIDNTHFTKFHEEVYSQLAMRYNAEFIIKEFKTPIDECIARDSLREKPVGKEVILRMAKQSGYYK